MNIEELAGMLKSVPMTVGGYAVLRDNKTKKYYFVEHPTEGMWLINKDFWYNYTKENFDKYELLSYQ